MITPYTPSMLARTAHLRWKEQFFSRNQWFGGWYTEEKQRIYEQLCVLGEYNTPAIVETLTGNTSWTRLLCDTCGMCPEAGVIQVGEPPGHDTATATLCGACLQEAFTLAQQHQIL